MEDFLKKYIINESGIDNMQDDDVYDDDFSSLSGTSAEDAEYKRNDTFNDVTYELKYKLTIEIQFEFDEVTKFDTDEFRHDMFYILYDTLNPVLLSVHKNCGFYLNKVRHNSINDFGTFKYVEGECMFENMDDVSVDAKCFGFKKNVTIMQLYKCLNRLNSRLAKYSLDHAYFGRNNHVTFEYNKLVEKSYIFTAFSKKIALGLYKDFIDKKADGEAEMDAYMKKYFAGISSVFANKVTKVGLKNAADDTDCPYNFKMISQHLDEYISRTSPHFGFVSLSMSCKDHEHSGSISDVCNAIGKYVVPYLHNMNIANSYYITIFVRPYMRYSGGRLPDHWERIVNHSINPGSAYIFSYHNRGTTVWYTVVISDDCGEIFRRKSPEFIEFLKEEHIYNSIEVFSGTIFELPQSYWNKRIPDIGKASSVNESALDNVETDDSVVDSDFKEIDAMDDYEFNNRLDANDNDINVYNNICFVNFKNPNEDNIEHFNLSAFHKHLYDCVYDMRHLFINNDKSLVPFILNSVSTPVKRYKPSDENKKFYMTPKDGEFTDITIYADVNTTIHFTLLRRVPFNKIYHVIEKIYKRFSIAGRQFGLVLNSISLLDFYLPGKKYIFMNIDEHKMYKKLDMARFYDMAVLGHNSDKDVGKQIFDFDDENLLDYTTVSAEDVDYDELDRYTSTFANDVKKAGASDAKRLYDMTLKVGKQIIPITGQSAMKWGYVVLDFNAPEGGRDIVFSQFCKMFFKCVLGHIKKKILKNRNIVFIIKTDYIIDPYDKRYKYYDSDTKICLTSIYSYRYAYEFKYDDMLDYVYIIRSDGEFFEDINKYDESLKYKPYIRNIKNLPTVL